MSWHQSMHEIHQQVQSDYIKPHSHTWLMWVFVILILICIFQTKSLITQNCFSMPFIFLLYIFRNCNHFYLFISFIWLTTLYLYLLPKFIINVFAILVTSIIKMELWFGTCGIFNLESSWCCSIWWWLLLIRIIWHWYLPPKCFTNWISHIIII